MLLDHVGAYLFPQVLILRIIGRVAFPIFAYQITIGYRATSSKINYFRNLVTFGIISQVPYHFLQPGRDYVNILFTFALAIALLWSWENKKYYLFLIALPLAYFTESGIYGIGIIFIFYFLREKKQILFFILATVTFYYYIFRRRLYLDRDVLVLLFATISSCLIIKKPIYRIKNIPKWFFYLFYPTHLVAILLIRTFFFSG